MKHIVLIALAIALQTSIVVHIYCLVSYLSSKKMIVFMYFMGTFVTNLVFCIIIVVIVMNDPKVLSGINMNAVYFVESGLIFIYMMSIKIRVTYIIIKRVKDPKNYHFSHFGKKIYNTTVVNFREVAIYFITFPFTLMAGAYFMVRIMRM